MVQSNRGQRQEPGEDPGLRPLQDRGRGCHRRAEGGGGQDGIKVHFLNSALMSGFTISLHFAGTQTSWREGPIFFALVLKSHI